jgi:hypothetical protein
MDSGGWGYGNENKQNKIDFVTTAKMACYRFLIYAA